TPARSFMLGRKARFTDAIREPGKCLNLKARLEQMAWMVLTAGHPMSKTGAATTSVFLSEPAGTIFQFSQARGISIRFDGMGQFLLRPVTTLQTIVAVSPGGTRPLMQSLPAELSTLTIWETYTDQPTPM